MLILRTDGLLSVHCAQFFLLSLKVLRTPLAVAYGKATLSKLNVTVTQTLSP